MIVRKTKPEERLRTDELFAIAFEMALENPPEGPESDRFHHWAAFTDDGDMMSTFTISDFDIQFDGHGCKMGGIGGVATLPQYRRMGGIRKCFEASLPDMYEHGYDFSYLYPFSTAYYRKFGYECCVQKYAATVHLGLLKAGGPEGYFCLGDGKNPQTGAIQAIEQVWEQRYNMMVRHSEAFYEWCGKQDPAKKQEFTYVYYGKDNSPKGYTTFRIANQNDGRNILCSRFFFVDKEGFLGLMGLFKSLSADHMYAKFNIPADCAMQYLMPEWSLGAAQWSVLPQGMVRVVNVESVLRKAMYRGSGEAVIRVKDPQIRENDGCFRVRYENGRAAAVEKVDAAPDVVLTIPAFSALIAGVCEFADAAQWFDGVEVPGNGKALAGVFYRKPMMITDFF